MAQGMQPEMARHAACRKLGNSIRIQRGGLPHEHDHVSPKVRYAIFATRFGCFASVLLFESSQVCCMIQRRSSPSVGMSR